MVRRARATLCALVVVHAPLFSGCRGAASRDHESAAPSAPLASSNAAAEPTPSSSAGATDPPSVAQAPLPGDQDASSAPPVPSAPIDPALASIMMRAGELRSKAAYAFQDRDGKTCLDDLDAADKIDPDPMRISTNPRSFLTIRASCTMLAGKCEAGKVLLRQAYTALLKDLGPSHIEAAVDSSVGNYCGDGAASAHDKLLVATSTMQRAHLKEDPDACARAHASLLKAVASFKPSTMPGEDKRDEAALSSAKGARMLGPMCVGSAGRCGQAYTMYEATAKQDGQTPQRAVFEALAKDCKKN